MVTVYLRKAGECSADALVTELAKDHFPGSVPEILRHRLGKPYFASGDVHFSVSHSGEYVAVAFGPAPLGIDLQQHKRRGEDVISRHGKLAARYFHPQEQKLAQEDLWEGFFRIWTAKESFVKRTGRGIDKTFSEFCVLPQGESWEDANGFFRQVECPQGYTLTLSTEKFTEWTIKSPL